MWLNAEKEDSKFDMLKWEEEWIHSEYKNETVPFEKPLKELINKTF